MSQIASEPTEINSEANKGGTLSEIAIRQKIAAHAEEIVNKMLELMRSRNENASLGATKTLLSKIVPDLKQTQITGENGEPIKLNIISGADYISALGKIASTSEASIIGRPAEIQSTDMAQAGTQDNNSNQPVSEVESA